jgi:protein import protein ZIM17|tara:strand:- start:1168 stop:1356 length:189 start_codon:yes stop_codon:yes gene_type:complete
MGWFGEPGSVEDFIAQKADAEDGEGGVARGSMKLVEGEDGTLEIDKSELEEWLKKFTASKGA